jgi:hypothetical protein
MGLARLARDLAIHNSNIGAQWQLGKSIDHKGPHYFPF